MVLKNHNCYLNVRGNRPKTVAFILFIFPHLFIVTSSGAADGNQVWLITKEEAFPPMSKKDIKK